MKTKDCKGYETNTKKLHNDTYTTERRLNEMFNTFVTNFKRVYQGPNTAHAQIGLGSKYKPKPCYSDEIEPLPLGPNFQRHVACFMK